MRSRRARPDEDLHRRVAGGQDGLLRDALLRDGGVNSFLKSSLQSTRWWSARIFKVLAAVYEMAECMPF